MFHHVPVACNSRSDPTDLFVGGCLCCVVQVLLSCLCLVFAESEFLSLRPPIQHRDLKVENILKAGALEQWILPGFFVHCTPHFQIWKHVTNICTYII